MTRLVIGLGPILVFMLGILPFFAQMDEGVRRCAYSMLGNYYCTPQELLDVPTSEQINPFAMWLLWTMASTLHVVGLMLLSMTAASGLALKSRNCALPVLGVLVVMLPCVLFVLMAVSAEGFFVFWAAPPSVPRFLLTVGGFAAVPWILTYAMGRVAARWVRESNS